ncbi:MAG: ABC transporter permease subunit [Bacillota bacterium]|nr:ABC transporter permease subunit [Bacillota bacterium]
MKHQKRPPWLLLLPILVIYALLIGGGLLAAFIESLGYIPVLGLTTFSLDSYRRLFMQQGFLNDFMFSLWIAFISSLLSTFLGVTIAYAVTTTRAKRLSSITRKAMQTGLILPYLYGIFLAVTMISQSGLLSRLFYHLGLIQEPRAFPELLYDRAGLGIVFVFVLKGTPFVALFVSNIMSRVSADYRDVAKTLRARNLTVLRKIYLPLCSTVIVWCASVLFAYDLGSFEVPYMLGALRPVALSARLYSLYISPDLLTIPQTMAMSVFLFLTGLICTAIYAIALKKILGGRLT